MATGARKAASDLSCDILSRATSSQFFQLTERLHRLNDENLETQLDVHPDRELVRYEVNPNLGFPLADVVSAGRIEKPKKVKKDKDEDGAEEADDADLIHYFIEVAFMGLQGASSPLPRHYLEQLASEPYENDEGARVPFMNFFNHRFLTLLHRVWRKYRYYVRFRPDADDYFSQYVYSFIGLNDQKLRRDTSLPWSRLLTFSGMIATRSRAPSMVAGIVAHCFDLEHVEIKQWARRYVYIDGSQINQLGRVNNVLGADFTIGDRVLTIGSKFLVSIKQLSQSRYRDFLPSGDAFDELKSLLEFLLRDQMAYDLELGLIQGEVPPFTLHAKDGSNLGWTTFVGNTSALSYETTVAIRGRN